MMAGRWQGMQVRLDARDARDQNYSRLFSYFSNRVRESLTYHGELIDENSGRGQRVCFFFFYHTLT